ncbi:sulfatase family protein [Sunxiuqinia sp. A32]|uniref:sulfatase family protein n=1 Tax=Sunxiuqinia sp. A32 TaxID=3461496 RepID=UPI00404541E4
MKKQFFGFVLSAFAVGSFFSVTAKEKPNVVIIFADDMGYGDVSINNPYARTTTPAIDQLAEKGIRFTDAHAGGAVCTPSRYSLLTGRYFFRVPKKPSHWGYLSPLIEPGRETIGSLMQKAGYTTAAVGKWHLGLEWEKKDESKPLILGKNSKYHTNVDFQQPVKNSPNELGFDYSFILPGSLDMAPYVFVENGKVVDPEVIPTADVYPTKKEDTTYDWDRKYTNENDIYYERGVWWRNGEMSKSFKFEDCLGDIVNHGLDFIDGQVRKSPEKPFLLYMALTAPHTPWLPEKAFQGSSELGTYGDIINQVDNIVDRVSKKLKELGVDENTLIIFSSDNGAPWAEDDMQHYAHQSNWSRRGQKGDIYDGGHHIPLIVSWPEKIKKPALYTKTVDLIDVIATFADLTGQQLPENGAEDSFSFMGVLNGDLNTPTRDHVIYLSSAGKLALKQGEWKYIDCLGSGGFTSPSKLMPVKNGVNGQLYNMDNDSLESNNLILHETERKKEMSGLLQKYVEEGRSRPLK